MTQPNPEKRPATPEELAQIRQAPQTFASHPCVSPLDLYRMLKEEGFHARFKAEHAPKA